LAVQLQKLETDAIKTISRASSCFVAAAGDMVMGAKST
jgi:hypothetical protein